jgi:uncharacterized SAM-binding protein YcdF (DUF218 family)
VAFWLKKALSYCLMPLPDCLALMIAGLWLLRRPRHQNLGRKLLATGVLALLLLSNNLVSTWLLRPLEGRYPALPELTADAPPPAALLRCRYVVVLGGGHGDVDDLPATGKLSAPALGRIVEGTRLLRVLPGARLVVSGGPTGNHPSHAAVLARAAETLGVAPDRIVKLETPKDTEDEAQAVRLLIGDAPAALVTSAWHMPRAAALFRKAGVDILPAPTDFLTKPVPGWHASDLLCEPESLDRSTLAVREYLGRLWVGLRGKT